MASLQTFHFYSQRFYLQKLLGAFLEVSGDVHEHILLNVHHRVVCHKSIRKGQKVKRPVDSKARRNDKSQSISGSEARQTHRQEAFRRTQ